MVWSDECVEERGDEGSRRVEVEKRWVGKEGLYRVGSGGGRGVEEFSEMCCLLF